MTKRVVSLDIGMKFVGVAATDPTWNFPVIIGTLERKDSIKDDLKRLGEMLDFDIAAFAIGYPIQSNGLEGSFMPVVKGFERRLKEIYENIPFFGVDEFLSSKEAVKIKNVKKKNYRKKKRSGEIDSTAAAVILERFMDSADFKKLKESYQEI
ncbi:Holliday junction resolvase RuvX [bacterium]|nr:Holliday junction resolvase RuvX [bacterium]MBP5591825.1 Holliday junction resolvase RuvX [bacterium]